MILGTFPIQFVLHSLIIMICFIQQLQNDIIRIQQRLIQFWLLYFAQLSFETVKYPLNTTYAQIVVSVLMVDII